jgi:hypothetical protein
LSTRNKKKFQGVKTAEELILMIQKVVESHSDQETINNCETPVKKKPSELY